MKLANPAKEKREGGEGRRFGEKTDISVPVTSDPIIDGKGIEQVNAKSLLQFFNASLN